MLYPKNGFLLVNIYNVYYICCNKRKDYYYFIFYKSHGPQLNMSDWIRHDFGVEFESQIVEFVNKNNEIIQ